jgi:DNA-binding CsgD family transcriptional regulator
MESAIAGTAQLVGREAELRMIDGLLDHVDDRGAALMVSGEPGIGKTALLEAASARASQLQMSVFKATGVQSEALLAFAGLHQLLQPVLRSIDDLAGPQRDALLAAFGLTEVSVLDPFLTALAVLEVLSDAAAKRPVLVIAEDVQWLDHPTADVLAFVARRLEHEPIVLLAATREGFASPLEQAGLPPLNLEALDPDAAGALLDISAPDAAPALRRQVLDEAAGNPLGLIELPISFAKLDARARPPTWLPLTTRLARAFAARLHDLPAATRTTLLVAALNDSPSLSEVLAAGALLTGPDLTIDALVPAVSARLIELDDAEITFRHPLMRSAIAQQASASQRHAAHSALAELLADQPERRVWHRAASVIGPDEAIALELEAIAGVARHRGASAVALAGLERAASLSADRVARGHRLLQAAQLGFELGQEETVARLVDEAEPLDLDPAEQARLLWLRGVFDRERAGGIGGLQAMIATATDLFLRHEDDLALNILWSAAITCWWSDRREIGQQIVAAAEVGPVDKHDPRMLAICAFATPAARGEMVMNRLSSLGAGATSDPDLARVFGTAANAVGAFTASSGMLAASATGLRRQGRLGLLARTLMQQAWSAAERADLSVAIPVAEEAARLTRETKQPTIHYTVRAIQAMLAALRGDRCQAEAHSADAEAFALTRGSHALLMLARHASGVAAFADGQYTEAFAHLQRIHDPTDLSHHSFMRAFTVADVVDTAVRSDQTDAVHSTVAELEELARQAPSPVLNAGLRYARPLLASDGQAEALFQIAIDSNADWPFLRARGQLAFGEWLRRRRCPAHARGHLRAARQTFDALGTIPWSNRARQELRASGETSRQRIPEARDQLTPQELQIAQLAATGLTNREIGQMLYLSHRTISSHLYRTFPKLGISSRAELRGVLERGSFEAGGTTEGAGTRSGLSRLTASGTSV